MGVPWSESCIAGMSLARIRQHRYIYNKLGTIVRNSVIATSAIVTASTLVSSIVPQTRLLVSLGDLDNTSVEPILSALPPD